MPKPAACKETPPAFRDAITGWFGYTCGDGTLLVPSPRCVGPECRGTKKDATPTLGYAGELDAGSKGSFLQAGRLIGVTAMDGVEIGQGLAAINALQQSGEIDGYYASAAKRAYLERIGDMPARAAPFETPSPFGMLLAPGALRRRFKGITGEDVGPSVIEACACTPRPFDARDPVSGWGIYYVKGGVLLTPSEKCIASDGKPPAWWQTTWRNVRELLKPAESVGEFPDVTVPTAPAAPPVPTAPSAKPPEPKTYLCFDPRIWPPAFRPQSSPCTAPQIPYSG